LSSPHHRQPRAPQSGLRRPARLRLPPTKSRSEEGSSAGATTRTSRAAGRCPVARRRPPPKRNTRIAKSAEKRGPAGEGRRRASAGGSRRPPGVSRGQGGGSAAAKQAIAWLLMTTRLSAALFPPPAKRVGMGDIDRARVKGGAPATEARRRTSQNEESVIIALSKEAPAGPVLLDQMGMLRSNSGPSGRTCYSTPSRRCVE